MKWLHSIGHVLWLVINLLAISALLMADCCVLLTPDNHFLPALCGLAFEPLLWLNVAMALSWLITSRKMWSLLGAGAIVLSLGGILTTYSHGSGRVKDTWHSIDLLTYNTHQCQQAKKAAGNDVLRYVKESGADVVLLQEYEVRKDARYLTFDEARSYLKDTYPYTYFDFAKYNNRRQYGLAIYSKYPLINKHTIRYESLANISDYCDMVVGEDTIRLFNNHLESTRFVDKDMTLDESEMSSDGLRKSARGVLRKLKNAYVSRAPEVRAVKEEIDRSPYPVIVVGDLNDVPVGYAYHTLSKGLEDAFLHTSWLRNGHTFIKKGMGVRIDHIFTSRDIHATRFKIDRVPYSDHYPVSATLTW